MREVFVPVIGMAPDDVTLVSWLMQPGDSVTAGDAVAIVETSKAEMEIEVDSSGTLGRHLFANGARIAPGATIAHVLADNESEPAAEMAAVPAIAPLPAPASGVDPGWAAATASAAPRHQLSPRRRREMATAATAPEPMPLPSPPPAHQRFREAVSASVSRSWQEIPHFTVSRELRVGELVSAVAQWRIVLPALTLTDLLLRSLALSLLERERRSNLDIGLAVATERGVAIPVVCNVLSLGLVELVDARRAAVERARSGKLHPDDGRIPASTLSNLGAIGVDQFTGVVPYGQTCMLTVGRAAPRPVVNDGELNVAATMHATLNVDHRSWDGYDAGLLLGRLADIVATPITYLDRTPVEPDLDSA